MDLRQQKRGWLFIALLALAVALVLLLALHSQTGAPDSACILPLLVAGILSPLCLFAVLTNSYASRVPLAPALIVVFQRPPPRR